MDSDPGELPEPSSLTVFEEEVSLLKAGFSRGGRHLWIMPEAKNNLKEQLDRLNKVAIATTHQ